ncbi:MAG TPA: MotA/TolQ/ExbB proton channel family protein [Oligoflexia bacterium]|nr:MotA/TolQ/ExbB proton channel family protein [Oligoflexia bacterium]HMP27039.1 MotA/TolQ/ExbB proton channel family protein [Oligoflexia bacterium]
MEGVDLVTEHSFLAMLTGSGPVVQFVLYLLIFLSVWTWGVVFAKILQFRKATMASREFYTIFQETRSFARLNDVSQRLASSPLVGIFQAGFKELSRLVIELKEKGSDLRLPIGSELATVEGALRRAEVEEGIKLERGLPLLSIVSSSAPFIGLFGTVWGIMNAFHGLSSMKSTTLQAVAPGISEALVATAIGLAAAIPAYVTYIYFSALIKKHRQVMRVFAEDFATLAKQQITF